jgi:hypothetical protein
LDTDNNNNTNINISTNIKINNGIHNNGITTNTDAITVTFNNVCISSSNIIITNNSSNLAITITI